MGYSVEIRPLSGLGCGARSSQAPILLQRGVPRQRDTVRRGTYSTRPDVPTLFFQHLGRRRGLQQLHVAMRAWGVPGGSGCASLVD